MPNKLTSIWHPWNHVICAGLIQYPLGGIPLWAQDEEDLARLLSMGFGEARARRALAHLAQAGASSGDTVQAAMERMLADPEGAHDESAAEGAVDDEDTASSSAAGARGEGPPAQEVSAAAGVTCRFWLSPAEGARALLVVSSTRAATA